jgi:hypothetical protein
LEDFFKEIMDGQKHIFIWRALNNVDLADRLEEVGGISAKPVPVMISEEILPQVSSWP